MSLVGSIELGGTKIICAIGNDQSEVLISKQFPTTTPEDFLQQAAQFFNAAETPINALGIACFGPIDINQESADYGRILHTVKPGWSQFPLRTELQKVMPVPTAVTTDVSGALIAEHAFGNARGCSDAVYFTVGTGVGGGIMVNGQIARGFLHPEIGHMQVPYRQGDGVCPFHGSCVEGLVSGASIAKRVGVPAEQLEDDHPIWDEVAEVLAYMVNNVLLSLAPQRVILGGGVLSKAGLIEAVREKVAALLGPYFPVEERAGDWQTVITAPGLTDSSGLIGGLVLANQLLADSA